MDAFEYLNNCSLSDLQTVGWLAGIKAPAYFGKRELIKWIIKLLREDTPQKVMPERIRPDDITPDSIISCTAIIEKARELIKENSDNTNIERNGMPNTFSQAKDITAENIPESTATQVDNEARLSVEECLAALKKASGIYDSKKLIHIIIDKLF